jgi:alpha-ketoglutarate-dependent taurine dioxygenase
LAIRAKGAASVVQLAGLLTSERERVLALQRRHGAILFRGFDITAPGELAQLLAAAGETAQRYHGGSSPRTHVGHDVYTSTELPPGVRIPLHSELAYLAAYPRHLWFVCVQPAAEGGETVLADARAVYRAIAPAVRARFVDRGVRYRCTFHGPSRLFDLIDRVQKVTKSWMETFETDDHRLAEARCRQLGADVHWLPSGRMVMELVRPAVLTHPDTHEIGWFNFAHLFRLNARYLGRLRHGLAELVFALRPEARTQHAAYGDGSEIEPAVLEHLFDVLDAETVSFPWQRGDALWIDNRLCMHGRNPFRGARRVLAAMST